MLYFKFFNYSLLHSTYINLNINCVTIAKFFIIINVYISLKFIDLIIKINLKKNM